MRDWFASINWLELELQFNMLIIQTNRCFIKSKIRDLLCIRRFSIETLNDYRISLIIDLFVIFTTHEIRIYEILLITSFDAYRSLLIEIWASMSSNRFFVFDLNRCKSFIRFWFESLQFVSFIWIVRIVISLIHFEIDLHDSHDLYENYIAFVRCYAEI